MISLKVFFQDRYYTLKFWHNVVFFHWILTCMAIWVILTQYFWMVVCMWIPWVCRVWLRSGWRRQCCISVSNMHPSAAAAAAAATPWTTHLEQWEWVGVLPLLSAQQTFQLFLSNAFREFLLSLYENPILNWRDYYVIIGGTKSYFPWDCYTEEHVSRSGEKILQLLSGELLSYKAKYRQGGRWIERVLMWCHHLSLWI